MAAPVTAAVPPRRPENASSSGNLSHLTHSLRWAGDRGGGEERALTWKGIPSLRRRRQKSSSLAPPPSSSSSMIRRAIRLLRSANNRSSSSSHPTSIPPLPLLPPPTTRPNLFPSPPPPPLSPSLEPERGSRRALSLSL